MITQVLSNHTIAGAPSSRRVLSAYLEETRCEALRLLRNPALVFPVMLMPVALYALFAVVIAGEAIDKDPHLGVFMFTAFSVMGISMPALFGLSSSLALEREMGLLQLKRAQPAPTGSWLVAKIFCGVAFGALAFLLVLTPVVFFHELGHFLAARWCGVKVKDFSIGFGREIFGFTDRYGTRWRFAWSRTGACACATAAPCSTSVRAPSAPRRRCWRRTCVPQRRISRISRASQRRRPARV